MLPLDHLKRYANVMNEGHSVIVSGAWKLMHLGAIGDILRGKDVETALMKKRQLGHSGIEVPTLCLGGNVFGWTADEQRSFEVLDALLESG